MKDILSIIIFCAALAVFVLADDQIFFGLPQAPKSVISQVFVTHPYTENNHELKLIENLRKFEHPVGYIPFSRHYQREKNTAIADRAKQWAEIIAWRFQSDPTYSNGHLKYSINDFEEMFTQFSSYGWNRDNCEQVLTDMGILSDHAETWCANVDPWGSDECADLTWPDFITADEITNHFKGKLDLQAVCRLIQVIRPSKLENISFRTVYSVCKQNIYALRDPLTAATVSEYDAEIICSMMDFTLSDKCKTITPKMLLKARDLAVAFGEQIYPRLLDFRISDACVVVEGMKSDKELNIESCRNQMIKLLWSRAVQMGDLLCPWGWDIISQFVAGCQEVFTEHAEDPSMFEEKAVILTGGFFNPSQSYATIWWKKTEIGQKLAVILATDPLLSQSLKEGILSPTQLMWAFNIHQEYKKLGNSVYSMVEILNMVRQFDSNEPQKSCENLFNLFLGKFKDNNINNVREQFGKKEIKVICGALEKQAIEICRKYLYPPLVSIARDLRSYFLKEMNGNTLMQLEDICLLVSSVKIPKISNERTGILRKCKLAMNKYQIPTLKLTFSQRYGLTFTQQNELCKRMDIWSNDKCIELPVRRRNTIHLMVKKLYDLSPKYGLLEYRYDEMCYIIGQIGDNAPREKCEFMFISELFSRWADSSNSFMQLFHNFCGEFFERRTTGKELKTLTKSIAMIKEYMDGKGEYALPNEEGLYQKEFKKLEKESKHKTGKYELLPSLEEGTVEEQGILRTFDSLEASNSPGIDDIKGKYYSSLTTIQLDLLNTIIAHKPSLDEKRYSVEDFAKVIYKLDQFNILGSCIGLLTIDLGYSKNAAGSICSLVDPLQSDACMSSSKVDLTSAKLVHQKLAKSSHFKVFIDLKHICLVVNHVNILKYLNKVKAGKQRLGLPSCRNAFRAILYSKYLVSQDGDLMNKLCEIIDITSDTRFNGGILKTNNERYHAIKLGAIYGEKLDLLDIKFQHPLSWASIIVAINRLNMEKNKDIQSKNCASAMRAAFGKFRNYNPRIGVESCCEAVNCFDIKLKKSDLISTNKVSHESNDISSVALGLGGSSITQLSASSFE